MCSHSCISFPITHLRHLLHGSTGNQAIGHEDPYGERKPLKHRSDQLRLNSHETRVKALISLNPFPMARDDPLTSCPTTSPCCWSIKIYYMICKKSKSPITRCNFYLQIATQWLALQVAKKNCTV